ncbi:bifunctional protein-serine/threonine kinase/phosphatase [Massilia sp. W12]|uniref:bifunctional protein-serine/threonine kinase/phosphatase n=1 Tax=Massilia sp. W12 TaxID=3126507 RepID=UPI0030CC4ACE
MQLQLAAGFSTECGPRKANEDFVGMVTPLPPVCASKGVLAALADGVGGHAGGRQAAEYTVRGLLTDYYATSDTWSVQHALDKVIQALNQWLQHQGSQNAELSGMACTLSCLCLRARSYHFAHVGDSRIYLLRGETLSCLTQDHVWEQPHMRHVLSRAIGLDRRILIDHGHGDLQQGDTFILVSDGVWGALPPYVWLDLPQLQGISGDAQAQAAAQALTAAALAAGGRDNASAIVLCVQSLGAPDLQESVSRLQWLPPPPVLQIGETIDGMQVLACLQHSAHSLVYQVQDGAGRLLVLKTLPEAAANAAARQALAQEEWLARRVVARFFPQVIDAPERHWLYWLCTWHAGRSLQQWQDEGRHWTIPEMLRLAILGTRALGALHRRGITHCDIKPDNLHLGEDGELRILDLGIALCEAMPAGAAPQERPAGTPSYLAPEMFAGATHGRQSDLYAFGVTLYYLLTRHYPYGEVEAFQRPQFGAPTAPARYRPEIPVWLEHVILKAVAADPAARFETAEELLLALEGGAAHPLPAPRALPLLKRAPLAFWQALALAAIVLNLYLLWRG